MACMPCACIDGSLRSLAVAYAVFIASGRRRGREGEGDYSRERKRKKKKRGKERERSRSRQDRSTLSLPHLARSLKSSHDPHCEIYMAPSLSLSTLKHKKMEELHRHKSDPSIGGRKERGWLSSSRARVVSDLKKPEARDEMR